MFSTCKMKLDYSNLLPFKEVCMFISFTFNVYIAKNILLQPFLKILRLDHLYVDSICALSPALVFLAFYTTADDFLVNVVLSSRVIRLRCNLLAYNLFAYNNDSKHP